MQQQRPQFTTSTPSSQPSSSRVHSESESPPASRLHEDQDLKDVIRAEIGDQAWTFSAEHVADKLSPKSWNTPPDIPAPDNPSALMMEVLRNVSSVAGPVLPKEERKTYLHIQKFLTECVASCDTAYDKLARRLGLKKRSNRWQPELVFSKFDRPTADGVDGAAPLKPDLIAASEAATSGTPCYWSLPRKLKGRALQILFAVEVKDHWPSMVEQAATYARAQFGANPLRTFNIVIAIHHIECKLRFLIFHRGGLTANHPLDLSDPEDILRIQMLLLSVLLWQTPQDAGLPSFTDGHSVRLPVADSEGPCEAFFVQEYLHQAVCTRGRATTVCKLSRGLPILPMPFQASEHKDIPSRRLRRSPRVVTRPTDQLTPSAKKPSVKPKKGQSVPADLHAKRTEATGHVDVELQTYLPERYGRLHFKSTAFVCSKPLPPANSALNTFVIKYSWTTKAKRGLEAQIYNACDGDYGTPDHQYSFEACYPDGSSMSNEMFLPGPDQLSSCHWPVFKTEAPKSVDVRFLCVTVFRGAGQSLESCETAWDLCECILDSMLGWLSVLTHGYLHRDVSIGNILKLQEPGHRKRFTARDVAKILNTNGDRPDTPAADPHLSIADDLRTLNLSSASPQSSSAQEDVSDDRFWTALMDEVRGDEDRLMIARYAKELEDVLAQFSLSDRCKAIINDGDMAAVLEQYFSSDHVGVISGTPEFMSAALRTAMETGDSYTQSPTDDLQSFWWATLWAMVYNPRSACPPLPSDSSAFHDWRTRLADSTEYRDSVVMRLQHLVQTTEDLEDAPHPPMAKALLPLLFKWWQSLIRLEATYKRASKSAEEPETLRLLFYRVAYRGVKEFVTLLHEGRELIKRTSG